MTTSNNNTAMNLNEFSFTTPSNVVYLLENRSVSVGIDFLIFHNLLYICRLFVTWSNDLYYKEKIMMHLKKMRLKRFLLFCLVFCMLGAASGQSSDGCLNTDQMYQIYLSKVNSVEVIMEYEKWLPVLENKNDKFALDGDTVSFSSKSWKYTMSYDDIFLKFYWNDSLFNNMLELQVSEACYQSVLNQMKMEGELLPGAADSLAYSFKKNALCMVELWQTALSRPTFHVRFYNPDEIRREAARMKERRQYEIELQRRRMLAVETALRKADSLRSREQFEVALAGLEQVLGTVPSYDEQIKRKMSILEVDIKNKKVKALLNEGEQLMTIRRYDDSRRQYAEVLKLEPANETALVAMAQIDRIKMVLQARKTTVYDYQQLNPEPYNSIMQQMQDGLNLHVDNSFSGRLRFKMNVAFDTLAVNRSSYIYYPESDPMPSFMDGLLLSPILHPTHMEGIAVSSLTARDFSLWWESHAVTARKKKNGNIAVADAALMPPTVELISSHLVKDEFPCGRYSFHVKEKMLNNDQYRKVSLTQYKTVGPEAMLYSMIYPGVGTIAATRASRGWTALSTFTLFTGAGAASYIFYKKQQDKFEKSAAGPQKDRFGKQANRLKWTSYICFGASAVIYLSDVITAITYGSKNRKQSKEMREKLKLHDIQIADEKMIIQ